MRPLFRSLLAVGLLAAGVAGTAVAGTTIANADTKICDAAGSTTVGDKYIVMNNRWGSSAEQCINVTSSGFAITSQQGTNDPTSYPVSFPNIYVGCYFKACSPGTILPAKLSNINGLNTSVSFNYVNSGTYDAILDIWLDPTANTDVMSQTEIRIWFNKQGSVQPVGYTVGNTYLAGKTWDVWKGETAGRKVLSFVAPSAISSLTLNVQDFLAEAMRREFATSSWYLTSMHAGFEPWSGGAGLAVTSFSAEMAGGEVSLPPILPPSVTPSSTVPVTPSTIKPSTTKPVTPSTTKPSSTKPVTPSSTKPPAKIACSVVYDAQGWEDGYYATVILNNDGTSAVQNWTLTYDLPPAQKVTTSWNATVTQASNGKVTATGTDWNKDLAAASSLTFGYTAMYGQGDTDSWPSNFRLNGTPCTLE